MYEKRREKISAKREITTGRLRNGKNQQKWMKHCRITGSLKNWRKIKAQTTGKRMNWRWNATTYCVVLPVTGDFPQLDVVEIRRDDLRETSLQILRLQIKATMLFKSIGTMIYSSIFLLTGGPNPVLINLFMYQFIHVLIHSCINLLGRS